MITPVLVASCQHSADLQQQKGSAVIAVQARISLIA
jgi:hypothetical protein